MLQSQSVSKKPLRVSRTIGIMMWYREMWLWGNWVYYSKLSQNLTLESRRKNTNRARIVVVLLSPVPRFEPRSLWSMSLTCSKVEWQLWSHLPASSQAKCQLGLLISSRALSIIYYVINQWDASVRYRTLPWYNIIIMLSNSSHFFQLGLQCSWLYRLPRCLFLPEHCP